MRTAGRQRSRTATCSATAAAIRDFQRISHAHRLIGHSLACDRWPRQTGKRSDTSRADWSTGEAEKCHEGVFHDRAGSSRTSCK